MQTFPLVERPMIISALVPIVDDFTIMYKSRDWYIDEMDHPQKGQVKE